MNMEDNAATNEYPQLPTHNMNGKILDGKDMMAAAPTPATGTKGPSKTKKRKKKANRSEDGKQPSKAQKAQSKGPKNSQVKVVAAKKDIGKGEERVRSDSYHRGEGTVSSSANSITSNIGISDDKDKNRGKDGKVKSSLHKKKNWVPDDDRGTNDIDAVAAAVTYSQQSRQQLLASSNDGLLKALQRKVENETKKEALAQKLQHMMSGGDDNNNNVSVNVDQPITSTERSAMNEMKKDALAQKLQRMMNGGEGNNVSAGAYGTVTNNLSTVPLGGPKHGTGQPGKKSTMDQNASSMLARSRTDAETKQVLNLYQSMMTQLVMHEQQQASDSRGVSSARSDPSGLSPSQSSQLAANIDDNVIRHLMLQSGEQQRALLQAPRVQESLRWLLQHDIQTNYQENGGDDPELIMRRQVMKEAKRDRVNRKLSAFMKSEEMLDEKQQAVTGKSLPSAEQQTSSSSDSTTLGAGSLLLSLSRGGGEWSVSPGERSHEQQDNGSTGTFPFVDSSVQHQQQQEQVTRVHSLQATQSRGVEEGRLSASSFQGLAYSGGVNNQAMLMQRLLLQRRENNGHAPQQTSQDNSQRIIAESQSPVGQGTDDQTMMLKLLLQRDLDDMNIQLHRQIQNNSLGQGVSARDGGINSQHTIDRNYSDLVRRAAIQSLLTNQREASQQPNTFSMDTSEAHDLARRRSLVESYIIMNGENCLRRPPALGGGDTPQHEMILENAQETSLHQALALQAMSQQPSAVASVASTDPDAQALNSEQFAQLISSARERYT